MLHRFAVPYFAGAVAALVSSLAIWIAGRAEFIDVSVAPEVTWEWLAPRLLWGSLWALALPLIVRRGVPPVRAGLLLSLVPTVFQLFYFSPAAGDGLLGIDQLGTLAPVVFLGTNLLWGWVLARLTMAGGGA